MQLSYKLKKVLSGDAYTSARRHMKQWLIGRAPLRFDVAKITATIDRQKFQEIKDRHAMDDPGDAWPKYLDIQTWMCSAPRGLGKSDKGLSKPAGI